MKKASAINAAAIKNAFKSFLILFVGFKKLLSKIS